MRLFLTGTDTNAGKTQVARALLLAARSRGLRALGYKPIESGCPEGQPGPDATALALAAGCQVECTYALNQPIAPGLAAEHQGISIETATIRAHYDGLDPEAELVIVEGAGGFLAPISSHATIADLAALLALPIVIVAADKLGSINHTLLTIEAVERRGLQVAAIVLSAASPDPDAATALGNSQQLTTITALPIYSLPWCADSDQLMAAGETLLAGLLADAEA